MATIGHHRLVILTALALCPANHTRRSKPSYNPRFNTLSGTMPYVSTFRLEVRSYELDVYNHVNNAVYINWLEHGRCKMLQDKGLDYTRIIDNWGVRYMTVRTEIDYRRPLHLGDNVEIATQVDRVGNTSVTLAQRIAKVGSDGPAAEARVVIVFTNAESGQPTKVPSEFVRQFA